jgi:hypothetical protein
MSPRRIYFKINLCERYFMNFAATYPSAFDVPDIGSPLAFPAILGRKTRLGLQFIRNAAATTGRTAQRIGTQLGDKWPSLVVGTGAGIAVQTGIKLAAAPFVAAAAATTLPAIAATLATGAAAGAGAVMIKQATDTYFYNRRHRDAKRRYADAMFSREALIKTLTATVGGAIGGELIAQNPQLVAALQSVSGHFASTVASGTTAVTRRVLDTLAGATITNLLTSGKRKGWRETLFSKESLMSTALGGAFGLAFGELYAHRDVLTGVTTQVAETAKHVASSFSAAAAETTNQAVTGLTAFGAGLFGFLKNHFGISSAHAETATKLVGEIKCDPKLGPHARCVQDIGPLLGPVERQFYAPPGQMSPFIAALEASQQQQPGHPISIAAGDAGASAPFHPRVHHPIKHERLSPAMQREVDLALNDKLTPQKAMHVLKEASFQLDNHLHNRVEGLKLLNKGVEIAGYYRIDDTPLAQSLLRDRAYMDGVLLTVKPPVPPVDATIATATPEPAKVAVAAPTVAPPAVEAGDAISRLSPAQQHRIESLLGDTKHAHEALRQLKDMELALNVANNHDAALEVLLKAKTFMDDNKLADTAVGKMVVRDINEMQMIPPPPAPPAPPASIPRPAKTHFRR